MDYNRQGKLEFEDFTLESQIVSFQVVVHHDGTQLPRLHRLLATPTTQWTTRPTCPALMTAEGGGRRPPPLVPLLISRALVATAVVVVVVTSTPASMLQWTSHSVVTKVAHTVVHHRSPLSTLLPLVRLSHLHRLVSRRRALLPASALSSSF